MDEPSPSGSKGKAVGGIAAAICGLILLIATQCGDVFVISLVNPVSRWLGCKTWVAWLILGAALVAIIVGTIVLGSFVIKDESKADG